MAALNNKIDFVVLVSANQANVNGDPLNGNRPRTDYSGYGEMSDVCIKRKIRNRMLRQVCHALHFIRHLTLSLTQLPKCSALTETGRIIRSALSKACRPIRVLTHSNGT